MWAPGGARNFERHDSEAIAPAAGLARGVEGDDMNLGLIGLAAQARRAPLDIFGLR